MKDDINKAVSALEKLDDDTLKARLGAYVRQFPSAPADFAAPGADVAISVDHMSIGSDAIDLGARIIKRWNKTLYDLACGGDVDPNVRSAIADAVKLGSPTAIAAAITGVLVSAFSVGPAIATLIGVVLGRLLLPAAGQEICAFWKERI
jgi:hypothetical protein